MKAIVLVPVLAALLSAGSPLPGMRAPASAAPGDQALAQQDFRWSGAIAPGQSLEIKGVNGRISAEPASGGTAEVVAVRRAGRRGRIEDVRLVTVPHRDGVTICAIYPSSEPDGPNRCTPGGEWEANVRNNDVNVDFEVRVPRGVHFAGHTVNGDIEAENLPANAAVSTVNGGIQVAAAGVVEASTVNGSIRAETGASEPGRALEFSTVNGSISLSVPAAFRARVRASVLNGSIRSDFPLRIERGDYVGQTAEGEIGRDGRTLKLETVNGRIELIGQGRGS